MFASSERSEGRSEASGPTHYRVSLCLLHPAFRRSHQAVCRRAAGDWFKLFRGRSLSSQIRSLCAGVIRSTRWRGVPLCGHLLAAGRGVHIADRAVQSSASTRVLAMSPGGPQTRYCVLCISVTDTKPLCRRNGISRNCLRHAIFSVRIDRPVDFGRTSKIYGHAVVLTAEAINRDLRHVPSPDLVQRLASVLGTKQTVG